MLLRIISSIILLPIFIFFILTGGISLKILIFMLSLIASIELSKVTIKNSIINYINYITLLIYYFLIDKINYNYFFSIIILYILINLLFTVFLFENIHIEDVCLNIFIFLYAGIMMSTIYLIRDSFYGKYLIWLIFISAWGSDTFAYFTGTFIGKHKLHPKLSPGKTIEGSIGGILGSLILSYIYYVLFLKNSNNINIKMYILISIFSPIFAQFGDLVASSIKRHYNLKDYGKIIPGHGGVLDRFDSIIFASSVVYIIILNFTN